MLHGCAVVPWNYTFPSPRSFIHRKPTTSLQPPRYPSRSHVSGFLIQLSSSTSTAFLYNPTFRFRPSPWRHLLSIAPYRATIIGNGSSFKQIADPNTVSSSLDPSALRVRCSLQFPRSSGYHPWHAFVLCRRHAYTLPRSATHALSSADLL